MKSLVFALIIAISGFGNAQETSGTAMEPWPINVEGAMESLLNKYPALMTQVMAHQMVTGKAIKVTEMVLTPTEIEGSGGEVFDCEVEVRAKTNAPFKAVDGSFMEFWIEDKKFSGQTCAIAMETFANANHDN